MRHQRSTFIRVISVTLLTTVSTLAVSVETSADSSFATFSREFSSYQKANKFAPYTAAHPSCGGAFAGLPVQDCTDKSVVETVYKDFQLLCAVGNILANAAQASDIMQEIAVEEALTTLQSGNFSSLGVGSNDIAKISENLIGADSLELLFSKLDTAMAKNLQEGKALTCLAGEAQDAPAADASQSASPQGSAGAASAITPLVMSNTMAAIQQEIDTKARGRLAIIRDHKAVLGLTADNLKQASDADINAALAHLASIKGSFQDNTPGSVSIYPRMQELNQAAASEEKLDLEAVRTQVTAIEGWIATERARRSEAAQDEARVKKEFDALKPVLADVVSWHTRYTNGEKGAPESYRKNLSLLGQKLGTLGAAQLAAVRFYAGKQNVTIPDVEAELQKLQEEDAQKREAQAVQHYSDAELTSVAQTKAASLKASYSALQPALAPNAKDDILPTHIQALSGFIGDLDALEPRVRARIEEQSKGHVLADVAKLKTDLEGKKSALQQRHDANMKTVADFWQVVRDAQAYIADESHTLQERSQKVQDIKTALQSKQTDGKFKALLSLYNAQSGSVVETFPTWITEFGNLEQTLLKSQSKVETVQQAPVVPSTPVPTPSEKAEVQQPPAANPGAALNGASETQALEPKALETQTTVSGGASVSSAPSNTQPSEEVLANKASGADAQDTPLDTFDDLGTDFGAVGADVANVQSYFDTLISLSAASPTKVTTEVDLDKRLAALKAAAQQTPYALFFENDVEAFFGEMVKKLQGNPGKYRAFWSMLGDYLRGEKKSVDFSALWKESEDFPYTAPASTYVPSEYTRILKLEEELKVLRQAHVNGSSEDPEFVKKEQEQEKKLQQLVGGQSGYFLSTKASVAPEFAELALKIIKQNADRRSVALLNTTVQNMRALQHPTSLQAASESDLKRWEAEIAAQAEALNSNVVLWTLRNGVDAAGEKLTLMESELGKLEETVKAINVRRGNIQRETLAISLAQNLASLKRAGLKAAVPQSKIDDFQAKLNKLSDADQAILESGVRLPTGQTVTLTSLKEEISFLASQAPQPEKAQRICAEELAALKQVEKLLDGTPFAWEKAQAHLVRYEDFREAVAKITPSGKPGQEAQVFESEEVYRKWLHELDAAAVAVRSAVLAEGVKWAQAMPPKGPRYYDLATVQGRLAALKDELDKALPDMVEGSTRLELKEQMAVRLNTTNATKEESQRVAQAAQYVLQKWLDDSGYWTWSGLFWNDRSTPEKMIEVAAVLGGLKYAKEFFLAPRAPQPPTQATRPAPAPRNAGNDNSGGDGRGPGGGGDGHDGGGDGHGNPPPPPPSARGRDTAPGSNAAAGRQGSRARSQSASKGRGSTSKSPRGGKKRVDGSTVALQDEVASPLTSRKAGTGSAAAMVDEDALSEAETPPSEARKRLTYTELDHGAGDQGDATLDQPSADEGNFDGGDFGGDASPTEHKARGRKSTHILAAGPNPDFVVGRMDTQPKGVEAAAGADGNDGELAEAPRGRKRSGGDIVPKNGGKKTKGNAALAEKLPRKSKNAMTTLPRGKAEEFYGEQQWSAALNKLRSIAAKSDKVLDARDVPMFKGRWDREHLRYADDE